VLRDRSEERGRRWPPIDNAAADRWRLIVLAAVGYAYVGVVIVPLVAAIVMAARAGAGGLVWLPVGLLVFVLGALWVRIRAPAGRPLTPAEAPELFTLIHEVRRNLGAPAPHVVLLTPDLNAAVVDLPRFVFFGSRRYLMLGLPLVAATPHDELRAVVAHEFAHLARHGRFRLWAARLQTTWMTLAFGAQHAGLWSAFLFVWFFRWFAPRFAAAVESASRFDEREADRLAAQDAGRDATVAALTRVALYDAFAREVLGRRLLRATAVRERPPEDGVRQLIVGLSDALNDDGAVLRLATLLRARALDVDSHPALADRLAALGVVRSPAEASAMVTWLRGRTSAAPPMGTLGGETTTGQLAGDLGTVWAEGVMDEWRRLHADAAIWQAEADAHGWRERERDVEWARARWAAACEPPDVALPPLRRVLDRDPDHSEARLLTGQLQLDRDDDAGRAEGLRLLERVLMEDSNLALIAAECLERHYAREGRADEQRRCRARAQSLRVALLRGIRERGALRAGDILRAHRLPAPAATRFRERLAGHTIVRRAFLVEKQTRHLGALPVVVLAVEVRPPWYKPSLGGDSQRVCGELAADLTLPLMLDFVVVPVEPRTRMLRRLRRIPGAELYARDGDLPPALPPPTGWDVPSRLATVLGLRTFGTVAVLALISLLLATRLAEERRASADRITRHDHTELVEAVRRNPEDGRATAELMWSFIDSGRVDEAMALAPAAVRLNPRDPYVHNSFGWLRMQQGEFDAAIPSFRTAIRLAPDHEFAHQNLGLALAALGRMTDAEAAFREAVRVQPDNPHAVTALAATLTEVRRFDDAEAVLHAALARAPESAQLHFALGSIRRRRGHLDPALEAFRESVRLAPGKPFAWIEIGILHHVNGEYPVAVEALQRAQALDSAVFARHPIASDVLTASRRGRPYQ
jgi:Flp pilus assembly protein TadD/Zn-dependent protease with chaperone function